MKNEQNIDLLLSSYDYALPVELIAQRPPLERTHCKLMLYNMATGQVSHHRFSEITNLLCSGDQLVLNQSKVFPCRLNGEKASGGKCELFLLSLAPNEKNEYEVMIKHRGKKQLGEKLFFAHGLVATVKERGQEASFLVSFNLDCNQLYHYLEKYASIPIPPYIRDGISDQQDVLDYQTVFAKDLGSVAAPTAGLHFSSELIQKLTAKNIAVDYLTLHVGAGTFRPVTSQQIIEHQMHAENFIFTHAMANKLNACQGRVIAVGTTSLRTLESCFENEHFKAPSEEWGRTNIFLHPGKKIKSIDGLITNFHLPKSSLLMLVSAMVGRKKTLELYQEAIENDYRFYSYGDAMMILGDRRHG